jgi:hypothetical protein
MLKGIKYLIYNSFIDGQGLLPFQTGQGKGTPQSIQEMLIASRRDDSPNRESAQKKKKKHKDDR